MNPSGWIRKTTTLIFSLTPNPAFIGQTVSLQGRLVEEGDQPVKGTWAFLYMNGAPVGHLSTNSTGWFRAQGKVSSAGTFTIEVEFNGTETLGPSSHTEMLTVLPKIGVEISFNLSPSPARVGQTITLTGNLADQYNNPISSAPVDLYYSTNNGTTWIYAGTLQTNSTGGFKATGKLTVIGTYLVQVRYKGNFKYNPASQTRTLTVSS
jgi:hypothetical protein